MRKIWITKLNKFKEVPEYEDLSGTAKEVCDLCRRSETACNSNTELCIEFWNSIDNMLMSSYENVIRKYPPETLTKIRRTLTEAELIFPKKEITKKRKELEKSYSNTTQVAKFTKEAEKYSKREQISVSEMMVAENRKYNQLTGEKI